MPDNSYKCKGEVLKHLQTELTRLIPNFKGRNLIAIDSLSKREVEDIVQLASCFKDLVQKFGGGCSLLKHKILTTLFYEPSTRTRCSFEAAMLRLDGRVVTISDVAGSSSAKGESLDDTIKTIEGYSDVIVLRHPVKVLLIGPTSIKDTRNFLDGVYTKFGVLMKLLDYFFKRKAFFDRYSSVSGWSSDWCLINPHFVMLGKPRSLYYAFHIGIRESCCRIRQKNTSFFLGSMKRAAIAGSKISLINAGDGTGEHPTQALTDIFTISELFPNWFELVNTSQQLLKTDKKTPTFWIAFVGDLLHGRTVHSLFRLLARYNVGFYFSNPPSLNPPEELINEISAYFKSQGFTPASRLSFDCSLQECIEKCNVVYMTRIQKERFSRIEDYERTKDAYCLKPEELKFATKNIKILHPLPRGNEISLAMDNTPAAAYFHQAQCGLYLRMALLSLYSNLDIDTFSIES
ncbi:aspartate carbamoyltransferase [Cardiosporidium cionae]|uniref:Aspartate carbamoyltransferase n=1 Tax=Cardiosporidium cionae TaxID=476202 RepID=A0ABQ7J825_9APIC|nr:aspartate carbamoyltransferase [Cardiosporidium cionae]|eukprot:KAF8820126.1 aspartate carbamoyltransferase [Cardiosporidium cionae]